MNELLEEEKEQQQAFERRRNLLLSDIAHDIKTPITTICGYSRALSEGVVAEEKKRSYLDVIYRKSLRMDELLTLLFEYVKLESEGFTLHKERGDLAELVRKMTALLYTDFEDKNITIVTEISEEDTAFEMDALQLGRAVTNLLTNALRYGRAGGGSWCAWMIMRSRWRMTESLSILLLRHIFSIPLPERTGRVLLRAAAA